MKSKSLKHFVLVTLTVIGSQLASTQTRAGVGGGNTELFHPVNKNGHPIEISFGSKHPRQDLLLPLIQKADLPLVLKSEILDDLSGTSITYSSEILTYADTQRQLDLALKRV